MSGANLFTSSELPLVSINAGQAIANGAALDNKSCRANHTAAVLSSAGVTAGTVQLQGSLDGVSWFPLGAALNINAAGTVFTVSVGAVAARFIRAQITVGITGGTVTATVGSA